MAKYVMGLDVGQSRDYTALVVAEYRLEPVKAGEWPHDKTRETQRYDLVHIERWRELAYPQQVARVAERVRELRGNRFRYDGREVYDHEVTLIVDATGVGKPILDALQEQGLGLHGVTITGGDSESRGSGVYRVPKRLLVSRLQIVLEDGRLKIARGLPLAPVLLEEFKGFKAKISLSGHDRYGNDVGDWREAEHDDLVLATSLITWWGERFRGPSYEALRRAAGR